MWTGAENLWENEVGFNVRGNEYVESEKRKASEKWDLKISV